ncbi:MAG TPA: hypothetical protein VN947_26005 [Polyangia bacterium]|nr:hypothetical protein [Polyangia bacterium]
MRGRSILIALLLVAGCGDNGGGKGNADMTVLPDMSRAPTDHPPLWRLQNTTTAPVQTAPEIWIVVWPGDEQLGADLVDFTDWMLHSDYWKTSMGEYGIGEGTAKGLIVLPTAPPASIGDSTLAGLSTMLVTSGQITGNANTQVAFFPPSETTVSLGGGFVSCGAFLGYHEHGKNSASAVAYSVNARCKGTPGEVLDGLTDTFSHEAAEAATDPLPDNSGGIRDNSPAGQEVADLCEFGEDMPIDVPPDTMHPAGRRYWVQRLYSDKRAAMGDVDPCLPLPWDHPYWNVAFDPATILGAAGSSAAIDARLDVFAYGDVGEVHWTASSSDADVEPPEGTAHAGDTIPITVTPFDTLRSGTVIEIDVISESADAASQLWMGYVKVP